MAVIRPGRYGAEIDGDFVVLLIGARLDKLRYVLSSIGDLGGRRRGMQAMLDALLARPEKGLRREAAAESAAVPAPPARGGLSWSGSRRTVVALQGENGDHGRVRQAVISRLSSPHSVWNEPSLSTRR
jgi:hypothetical protein